MVSRAALEDAQESNEGYIRANKQQSMQIDRLSSMVDSLRDQLKKQMSAATNNVNRASRDRDPYAEYV
jgi:hypothetical protein